MFFVISSVPALVHAGEVVEFVPVETRTGPEPVRLGPLREGVTLDFGFGLHYTTAPVSGDDHLAGAFGVSLGYFVNDTTAVLLRGASSHSGSIAQTTVDGQGTTATLERTRTTYFLGPALQTFPSDRFMLSAGLGVVDRRDAIDYDVHYTSAGDYRDAKNSVGLGASLRAGFAIYQRHSGGAIRLTADALPSVAHGNWALAAGLTLEVQIY